MNWQFNSAEFNVNCDLNFYLMADFSQLGIPQDLIKGITELNIIRPSEIQEKAIPILVKGETDFFGQAQTGTGKTAAFGLPLLTHIQPEKEEIQGLILAPTRELCQQIGKQLFKFTKYANTRIFVETVYGGAPIDEQIKRLQRPTHIVVATPGRLLDLMDKKALNIDKVKFFVLDEADEMLSMGFKDDMFAVLKAVPQDAGVWLFSATLPEGVKQIVKTFLKPGFQKLEVERSKGVNADITHEYVICHTKDKVQELNDFLNYRKGERGMIFCQTKRSAQTLTKQLQARNLKIDVIEGDMGQRDRDKVMRMFKSEKIDLLIATDIAARGIDVKDLNFVLHYQLPQQIEYYTHRSGRTGRAGQKGYSILFINEKERERVYEIAKTLKIQIKALN